MKSLNLKPYGKNEISFYLAVEEYLLSTCQEDVFFLWDLQKSIIIGRNQLLAAEVNVDYANKLGAKIYRRPSGGGAIFADEGCFMFSFVSKVISKEEAFKKYLDLMVNALRELELDVTFSGRNDLMFMGKKFSGNAYYQNKNGSVLHGTFLFGTNLENLVRSITPDNEKLISKGIKSVSERVINIGEHITMAQDELMDYLLTKISNDEEMLFLSELDYQKIKQLEKKYKEPSWVFGQDPPFTFKSEKRFPWGKIAVYIDVKKNKVISLDIKGDFLLVEDLEEFKKAFIGKDFTYQAFQTVLLKNHIDKYIMNSTNDQFLHFVFEEENDGEHS